MRRELTSQIDFALTSGLVALMAAALMALPVAGTAAWALGTVWIIRLGVQQADSKQAGRWPAYVGGLALLAAGVPLHLLMPRDSLPPIMRSSEAEPIALGAMSLCLLIWLGATAHLTSRAGAGSKPQPATTVDLRTEDEREADATERNENIDEIFDAVAAALPDYPPRRRAIRGGEGLMLWRNKSHRAGLRVLREQRGKGAWVFFGKAWLHVDSRAEAIAMLRGILDGDIVEVIGLHQGIEVDRRLAPTDDAGHGVNHLDTDHRHVEVPMVDAMTFRRWPTPNTERSF